MLVPRKPSATTLHEHVHEHPLKRLLQRLLQHLLQHLPKMSVVAASGWLAASLGAAAAASAQGPAALPGYGADPDRTTVSGLSSGAFMAVQLQVAFSKSIAGAGVVAGGPYYCAAGAKTGYTGICMGQVPFMPPNPSLMVGAAKGFAATRRIDKLANLAQRRIYVFSGTDDSIVRQQAVDATVSFFQRLGVPAGGLKYVNTLPAGHAVITPAFGNDCAANAAPYISHCTLSGQGYDQAGELLQHLYGNLQTRVATPTGELVPFDQRPFAPATTTGMATTGFVYVPTTCTGAGAHCKVHVALHGCSQSQTAVGDAFTREAGYNHWADSNGLLVLYPQVDKSDEPYNPYGCWDWWGYTGTNYADRSALQMKAIKAMVARLVKQP